MSEVDIQADVLAKQMRLDQRPELVELEHSQLDITALEGQADRFMQRSQLLVVSLEPRDQVLPVADAGAWSHLCHGNPGPGHGALRFLTSIAAPKTYFAK